MGGELRGLWVKKTGLPLGSPVGVVLGFRDLGSGFHLLDGLLDFADVGEVVEGEALGGAHGVSIAYGSAVATSAVDGHILKIDRATAVLVDDTLIGGHGSGGQEVDLLPSAAIDPLVGDDIVAVLL